MTPNDLYITKGEAIFLCPELRKKGVNAGHSKWVFCWQKGDYHIEHPQNGIPKCDCGKELVYVGGDDPQLFFRRGRNGVR